jgi:hypothetical protein
LPYNSTRAGFEHAANIQWRDNRKLCLCQLRRASRYDKETKIREVSAVFTQERSENGKTKKSWHVQQQGSSK